MRNKILVTADNLETVRVEMAAVDQREELVPGCATWAITYEGGQRGQMTIWPGGRGAVAWGGDSQWGEWDERTRTLHLDTGEVVDESGEIVTEG
jgi:hypothetical protein